MYTLLHNFLNKTRRSIHSSVISHFALILIFTLSYYIGSHIDVKYYDSTKTPFSLFDSFYFSLVTQTTVGYGHILPTDYITKLINTIQLLSIYGVVVVDII